MTVKTEGYGRSLLSAAAFICPERIGKSALRLSTAAMLAGTLVLAGCGGSGDEQPVEPPGPTMEEQQIAALEAQIAALRAQLGLPADGDVGATVAELQAQLKELQDAKDAADAAAADAEKAAMMATAKKLYEGISAPTDAADAAARRNAAYSGTNDANITVLIGTTAEGSTGNLSEDKEAMVAALHGWEGKKYTASPDGGGTYEAVVYSNVGDATEGNPFNEQYPETATFVTNGVVTIDTSGTDTPASRVASSSFDQSAGLKRFKLPDPNPGGATKINVSGSFHGVSGTYTCTPGTGNTCVSRVAANGFDLGVVDASNAYTAGSWTFVPTTPTAKVMSVADMHYASYGWWIHKGADGTYTASAFVDDKDDGTDANVPAASGVTALQGSATYSGGAAGKYALYSSTGGTNDAGHFTAAATLEADFGDDTVTGTIGNFMGADGNSRNWSVKLMTSVVGDNGAISGSAAQRTANETLTDQMTVWTIDGTAAAASGAWSGSIQNNDDNGVPRVATGTFTSEYSTAGEMVGAFGANKQ